MAGTDAPQVFFGPYYYEKNVGLDGLYLYGGVAPKPDYVPEAFTWVMSDVPEYNSVPVLNGLVKFSMIGHVTLKEFEQNRKEMGLKYYFKP